MDIYLLGTRLGRALNVNYQTDKSLMKDQILGEG